MKPENAIEVNNVTKKFRVYLDKGHTLKEKTLFQKRRAYEERMVLNKISFAVRKGEAVGLIGHNGCGKSTTLKLLTKIMYPDSGSIEMGGRVSSLIELGAGFHPDMSGRENIYINASIFGLSKREIEERLEDVIAFSELEQFVDNPVRTYSSGMYMRLAFSVAINVDADILLIDEILGVGDAGFQAKCFNRLKEIKSKGTTIVIVSHSLGQIEQICDRSIWIQEGRIREEGNPRDVHPKYLDYMGEQRQMIAEKEQRRRERKSGKDENKDKTETQSTAAESGRQKARKLRWGNGKARIEAVRLLDSIGKESTSFATDSAVTVRIEYKMREAVKNAVFGIGIFRVDGVQCYGTNTRIDRLEDFDIEKDGVVCFMIRPMALLPGSYLLDVSIESDMGIPVDFYREACRFELFSAADDVGIVRLNHEWHIEEHDDLHKN